MSRFRKLSQTIWCCQYHIVWVPKYRFRILTDKVAEEVENYVRAFSPDGQGGSQALRRSFYATIIPPEKSAEFLGFYNMIGQLSTIIGPGFMACVGLAVISMGYSSNMASRISLGAVSLFFLAGGVLLFFVSQEKGKKELQYISVSKA